MRKQIAELFEVMRKIDEEHGPGHKTIPIRLIRGRWNDLYTKMKALRAMSEHYPDPSDVSIGGAPKTEAGKNLAEILQTPVPLGETGRTGVQEQPAWLSDYAQPVPPDHPGWTVAPGRMAFPMPAGPPGVPSFVIARRNEGLAKPLAKVPDGLCKGELNAEPCTFLNATDCEWAYTNTAPGPCKCSCHDQGIKHVMGSNG